MNIPWASGPRELLSHGLELLDKDSDSNRRLAMISIDNAVELMIKTYLGLPKRITGISIPRKEYQELSESFPLLLDAIEKYASDKISSLSLGEIEWYHRLRNQLYHQGNGLTVEKDKVNVYSELAKSLFENLFGEKIILNSPNSSNILGEFISSWIEFEKSLESVSYNKGSTYIESHNNPQLAYKNGFLNSQQLEDISNIRKLRNKIMHGETTAEGNIDAEIIHKIREITDGLNKNRERIKSGIDLFS